MPYPAPASSMRAARGVPLMKRNMMRARARNPRWGMPMNASASFVKGPLRTLYSLPSAVPSSMVEKCRSIEPVTIRVCDIVSRAFSIRKGGAELLFYSLHECVETDRREDEEVRLRGHAVPRHRHRAG